MVLEVALPVLPHDDRQSRRAKVSFLVLVVVGENASQGAEYKLLGDCPLFSCGWYQVDVSVPSAESNPQITPFQGCIPLVLWQRSGRALLCQPVEERVTIRLWPLDCFALVECPSKLELRKAGWYIPV